jgi:predicted nucleic acid-binding protein
VLLTRWTQKYSDLRRLVATREPSEDRANDARSDFAATAIARYPHGGFAERVWELRHELSVYDAVYLALAEVLDVPFVTCDRSLWAAPGHRGAVEVFAPHGGE